MSRLTRHGSDEEANTVKKWTVLKCLLSSLLLFSVFAGFAVAAEKLITSGPIPDTEMVFSDLVISKSGIDVKLTNNALFDVSVSLRLSFYDEEWNRIGYALFGLREIPAGNDVDVTGNHLNGNWKKCRNAYRLKWEKMTYKPATK